MITKINADNLKYLTLKQKKAAVLMLEGRSYVEISKILGCSKQNVSQLLKSAGNRVEIKSSSKQQMFIPSLKRQEKITIKKQEEDRRKQEAARRKREAARKRQEEAQLYRKERYLGKSLSVLTPAESRVFLLWLDGFTYQEIGENLQVSTVGTLLNRARKKLDGTYEETRQQINLRRKENRKKRHEEDSEIQHKSKSREQRLSDMKEYNKHYYQAHREEILSRRKSKNNVPKL